MSQLALNFTAFWGLMECVERYQCSVGLTVGMFRTPKIGKWSLNEVERTPANLNESGVDVISTSIREQVKLVNLVGSVIDCVSTFAIRNSPILPICCKVLFKQLQFR